MNNDRVAYLQMIQGTIDRMSTTSAIFKGFCATIIAEIATVASSDISKWVLLIAVLLVLCFLMLDVYYLQLEKRFRFLYNRVRLGEHRVDFDLTPPSGKDLHSNEKYRFCDCLKSPSIIRFYIPSMAVLALILIMKFKEVI